jgi:myo-inositol 2-dehydrogenase/D-chiro-inositol 1-dehydrogenase
MTVNIGVIGVGMIGQDHIRRITEVLSGGRVAAVTDIDPERAAAVAAARGAEVFADAQSLIDSPTVDAVVVTSFGPAHEASVLAAIAAGKPVFCEKPLTPTAAGCLRVIEAEVAAGRRYVQVGFMRRYDASYRAMKAILDAGQVGDALLVHCAHRNPAVQDYYTADMAINDTAIHEIDTMRWLLGEEIVQVRVDKPKRTRNRAAHLQDPLVFIMETASGVRVDDEVFVNCQYAYDIRCELVAETGIVSLSDQNTITLRNEHGRNNPITADWRERFIAAYDTEVQDWIRSVETGVVTGPSAWDGYAAAAVCDAGVRALEAPESVLVPVELVARPALYA